MDVLTTAVLFMMRVTVFINDGGSVGKSGEDESGSCRLWRMQSNGKILDSAVLHSNFVMRKRNDEVKAK